MPRGQYERRSVQAQGERPETETQAPAALNQRAAEMRRERRRRDDGNLDRMGRMALAIPPEVRERLEKEGKVARWVRDAPGRQAAMHADDWDVSPEVAPVSEARDSDGKLVLMEKYKDWYDDDQRKKLSFHDEREKALKRGDPTDPDDTRDPSRSYTPDGNSISRKSGL